MLSFLIGSRIYRSLKSSFQARRSVRPGVEQLEIRNLLSVITPFSLAQELQGGFNGYSPTQLLQAYGISQLSNSKPGQGEAIAIVDAYESPNIQSDVTTFDSEYGLPAINLSVVNDGATKQDPTGGWELETALDVEWAHAVAPYANIVLVEAANDSVSAAGAPTALLNAVSVAASQPDVTVVSMSWGVPEFKTETQYDSTFAVPGVTFVAASGDSGEPPIWPAVSPNVLSVGGTTLQSTNTSGVYAETGWGDGNRSDSQGGSGGGISLYEPEPSYQVDTSNQYVTSVTSAENGGQMRMSPDVSYDANPSTGVAMYDASNGGWQVVGGTSAGTPQWAGLVAVADQNRVAAGLPSLSSTQTLTALYQEQGDFYDITSGNNGYSAGTGYDLVTGLGSPQANLLIPALAKESSVPGLSTTDPARTSGSTSPTPTPPAPTPVSGPDFTVTGTQVQATSGQAFTGTVATITSTNSGETASDFSAIIEWGDGAVSAGTVIVDSSGGFEVTGTHTYNAARSPGWGFGWGQSRFYYGWGGGNGPTSATTENFRITVIVADTTSRGYELAYSEATVTPASTSSSTSTSAPASASGGPVMTPNQLFVVQAYQNLLDRAPDAGGLAYWSGLLDQGVSTSTIVLQIEMSQEYLGDEVEGIYEKMLQRPADPGGLAAFTTLLANGGTVEQVETAIAGSAEYYQTRGGGTGNGFLEALYADALNRNVDSAGQAYFGQELASGVSTTVIAEAVFGSVEYRQDLVESYYQAYLGRPADSAGLAYFTGVLGQGATDQEVLAAIMGSQEYYQELEQSS